MYPDTLKIGTSKKTPLVVLEQGKVFIMGQSIPENPGDFFRPVFEWISKYSHDNSSKTKIELGFEYINTSSTKWIYTLLKELAEMKGLQKNGSFTWYYEHGDDDMYELGFILRSLLDCSFVIIEVAEMNDDLYNKILSGAK